MNKMIESVRKEKERIRLERKTLVKDAVGILIVAAALFVFLVFWRGEITGYHSLNTFESDIPSVSKSTPGSTLLFEDIPNINASVGEEVHFKVIPNIGEKVIFSDNTQLFEIDEEGTVRFTPESPGNHRVFIIITNSAGEYYMKDFRIIIQE
ncbi:hypothetical protein ACFL3V_04055 [Nanoarchaeota archaeon]